ncbi:hypothetical protein QCQ72_004139 [Bacillus cereus]|nr:hypothetical protein [Bacillus cereus]
MIENHRKSDLHNGFHMESTVKLSDNGRLDGIPTHIWSTNDAFGFTGGVVVFLGDADDNIIFRSRAHTGAVDGVRVGDPSNDLYWNEEVSQDIVDKATKLEIMHIRAPRGRIEENLDELIRIAEKIERVAEVIRDIGNTIGEIIDW